MKKPGIRRFRSRRQVEDYGDFTHPALTYRAPRRLRIYRTAMATVLSVLLVVGGWTLYWAVLASVVKKQATGWVEHHVATGNEAGYAELSLGGFPTRVELTFRDPVVSVGNARAGFRWSGEQLKLAVGTLTPWRMHLDGAGRFRLSTHWQNADAPALERRFSGRVEGLNALLNPGQLWPDRLQFSLSRLSLSNLSPGADATRLGADALNLDVISRAAGDGGQPRLRLRLNGRDLMLPWPETAPLAPDVQQLEMVLDAFGPMGDGGLRAWQAAGGALKVHSLALAAEGASLAASGDVALDDQLRPTFQLNAKIGGLLPLLNRLRDQGYIRDSDAVLAKMTLVALSRREADGRTVVNLNVEGHDGNLYLGPVRVGDIPMVDWSVLE